MLLAEVIRQLHDRGWFVVNLDATVIAEAPKLAPYIDTMRQCLSGLLGIGYDDANIKATTTEHLGFTGRQEGIAAQAVVLIRK